MSITFVSVWRFVAGETTVVDALIPLGVIFANPASRLAALPDIALLLAEFCQAFPDSSSPPLAKNCPNGEFLPYPVPGVASTLSGSLKSISFPS